MDKYFRVISRLATWLILSNSCTWNYGKGIARVITPVDAGSTRTDATMLKVLRHSKSGTSLLPSPGSGHLGRASSLSTWIGHRFWRNSAETSHVVCQVKVCLLPTLTMLWFCEYPNLWFIYYCLNYKQSSFCLSSHQLLWSRYTSSGTQHSTLNGFIILSCNS